MATAQSVLGYVVPLSVVVSFGKQNDWKSSGPVSEVINKTTPLQEADMKLVESFMTEVIAHINDKNKSKFDTINIKLMINHQQLSSSIILLYDNNNRLTQNYIPSVGYQHNKVNNRSDDFFKDLIYEWCLKNGSSFVEHSQKCMFLITINSIDPKQLI